mgnify:CR=1 FL=1|tara:strand:+ start:436 stop:1044 length:609 start_codon:yes stop_codon:yes gene_type:complete
MTLTTYAGLQSAIADFLDRQDLTASIPTFIALAEARISRDLSHWKQEVRLDTTYSARYQDVPSDFIEAMSLHLTDGGRIMTMAATEMQERRGTTNNEAGKPASVRLTAGQFELFPTPDASYNVSLLYRARIPALADDATSNWLLLDAPDVLLYAALGQSAPYLKDDSRLSVWAALYQSAVDALNAESKSAKSIGTVRMGVPR